MLPLKFYCLHKPGHRAFTLLEMLVVIAIIAVLAALAFPLASRMIASGQTAKATSNLRQIGVLVSAYAAENNNRLPPLRLGWGIGTNPENYVFFQNLLRKNTGLPYDEGRFKADQTWLPEIFYDPMVKAGQQHLWGCFGANDAIIRPDFPGGTPVISIGSPSRKVIVASAADSSGSRFRSSWLIFGQEWVSQGEACTLPRPDPRHGGKTLCLFADGHIERLDTAKMTPAERQEYFLPDAN